MQTFNYFGKNVYFEETFSAREIFLRWLCLFIFVSFQTIFIIFCSFYLLYILIIIVEFNLIIIKIILLLC